MPKALYRCFPCTTVRKHKNTYQYIFLFYYQNMLSQRNKQKENNANVQALKSGNMLYKAIEVLKQDKQNLVKQNQQRERYHEQQKKKLRIQLEGYKRKIAQLTQSNILNNLIKKQQPNNKIESQYLLKIRKLELEVQHFKRIVSEKEKIIENHKANTKQLEKKIKLSHQQKQKHMEISLTQKINLEEKIQLQQQQIQSKKKIIEGLKRQIEKANKLQFELTKKQRQIIKRARDMSKYQQQFSSYYSENEKKYQRKIEAMQSQNNFLRKQIKKIVKKVKITCQCDGQAEQWKQKLYQVGKQLAKARVQLGKKDLEKQNNPKNSQIKKKIKQPKSKNFRNDQLSNQDSSSMDSLSLSQQSDNGDISCKPTQKKK